MLINLANYNTIKEHLSPTGATLVAVSKVKPPEAIQAFYNHGQRDFGENYVQEMVEKQALLPADIRWHFIGHLQSNKVKYIAPFVHLIHGIDSLKLLKEVNKQALKNNRVINVLLQVYIAKEETKFGFAKEELENDALLAELDALKGVSVAGLMGMGSLLENEDEIRTEFRGLKALFDEMQKKVPDKNPFQILSMGMSGDYRIALEEGSNMVRVGSLLFGQRTA